MKKGFYFKLALRGISGNRRVIFPYMLTSLFTVMMFYILASLRRNSGIAAMPGGDSVGLMLALGTVVIGIFSVLFLFYTNSFLMKRRKKEIGLYNILGLEKSHIGKMLFCETLITSGASIILGLIFGTLLCKLMFVALLKILGQNAALSFRIDFGAMLITAALFAAIFLVTLLWNLAQIHLSRPIELLGGGNVGEKEPKAKVIVTIIGLIALIFGYYLSVTVEDPMAALIVFFFAVILVIIGTYCLFLSGTITLLKLLRRNKKFYYKTKHFTSVSGLLYRMKQNAAGLANICILSTAVLVTLSTTLSLYIGSEAFIKNVFKDEIRVVSKAADEGKIAAIDALTADVAAKSAALPKDSYSFRYYSSYATEEGGALIGAADAKKSTCEIITIPLADYNKKTGASQSLREGEALLYIANGNGVSGNLKVQGREFVVTELHDFPFNPQDLGSVLKTYYLVVPDLETAAALTKTPNKEPSMSYVTASELSGSEGEKVAYAASLKAALGDTEKTRVESRATSRTEYSAVYGGFFFIGLFLGALFLMATVLIIYYKQVSEGYDDKVRFAIMQKVGMAKNEVRRSIKSQILMVFFLPLGAAIVHICFAFPVIKKLLSVFQLTDTTLFAWCLLGVVLAFAAIYTAVYLLTAKTYYKITE